MCLSKIKDALDIIEKLKKLIMSSDGKKSKEISIDTKKEEVSFPYYFKDFTKHITIYKNGNGIIINSSTLIVTDLKRFNKIYRKLNIEDGKEDSNFPPLDKMMKVEKKDRFEKFGFWYGSDKEVIERVREYYWSDTDKAKEDKKIKGNTKELRWIFDFNKGRMEENRPYKILYVISIKGMYPLENGFLNCKVVNDPNSIEENFTEMDIIQDIEKFKYVVSFEDGIELFATPKCHLCHLANDENGNEIIKEEKEDNLLFTKYYFNIEKPLLGSKVKVFWKFKELPEKGE